MAEARERPNSNNSNSNANPSKRGKAIELHGLTCQEINDSLKGLSPPEIKKIVNKFPDRTTTEYSYKTALQVAVLDNNKAVVECLLELGADPDKRFDVKTYTPIHLAVLNNNIEIVNLLLPKADIELGILHNDRVFSPIYTASEKGFIEIIHKLAEEKRVDNINEPLQDKPYMTPLTIAVLEGHKKVVKLLKRIGAKFEPKQPYTKDEFQEFLITDAYGKRLERIQFLLEDFEYLKEELELDFDVDLNYYSVKDYSVLYNAFSVPDNVEVVEYLLSKGAALDPKPYQGKNEQKAMTEIQRLMEDGIFEEYIRFLVPIETPLRPSLNNNTPRAGGAARKNMRKQRHTRKQRRTRRG